MSDIYAYQTSMMDGQTALAMLQWQIDLGASEPLSDSSIDWFAIADAPEASPLVESRAPATQPATAVLQPAAPSELIARAEVLAQSASTLAELAAVHEAFDGLELKRGARNFCFSDGNPTARVLILGEAPGDEEDRQGRPFVGRAGQMLDRMFAAIGLSRSSVDAETSLYITNVLAWHPPGNRDPNTDEIAISLPFVRRHIELIAPEVVVLMGNVACEAILGRRGILRLRGAWVEDQPWPVMPMAHPAYLLRNPAAKREAWADLLAIAARLGGP